MLLATLEPCAMCFAAAGTTAVDVIGYVLPAFGDGVEQSLISGSAQNVPRLVRVGSPELIGCLFERFVVENPDSRYAEYATGVVARLKEES